MAENYSHIKDSPIHKGLVLRKLSPGLVKVWIPTANSTVPQGQFKFMYSNSGSALDGKQLEMALATSYTCRVATPLSQGSWMRAALDVGASVFGHGDKDQPYDYRLNGSIKSKIQRGITRISHRTDNPQQNYAACNYTLGEVGGMPIESIGNMPPGDFPDIEPNQWVLVAFVNSSYHPIVIASLPGEQEWEAALKN